MDSNFFEALKLMCIGLCSVFVVILVIIVLGNLLVKFINKYCPEEEAPAKVAPVTAVSADVAQAISLAVSQLTSGKGKVEKIEKV